MMNHTDERLARLRAMLREFLAPTPLGQGPIRLEDWGSWTQEQHEVTGS